MWGRCGSYEVPSILATMRLGMPDTARASAAYVGAWHTTPHVPVSRLAKLEGKTAVMMIVFVVKASVVVRVVPVSYTHLTLPTTPYV